MNDIATRILNCMNEKKISYGELSSLTKISKSVLQRYATGETEKIPVDRLELIAHALHVSPAYLMGWEDEKKDEIHRFSDPKDAMMFVIKNPIMMAFGGYDIKKMSDDEILEFANQTVDYMAYVANKYKNR